MKKLTGLSIIASLIVVGCSEGFKTDPDFSKKVTGTGYTGGTTGYGGTTGGTTGGTSGGTTTGSSCTAGSRGSVPDLGGLVTTFNSLRGSLLAQDCGSGTTNNYIQELVVYLRAQTGNNRIGYNGNRVARDTIAYLWDNGSCDGSTNTTIIDVVGGFGTCQNSPSWLVTSDSGSWTMTPPPNSGTGGSTGGSSGGTTSGGTSGGTITEPPDEEAAVEAIDAANPGMINDCTGIPIVNNFLLTVVRSLQQKDPRWGFMKKSSPFRIPRDVLAYRWSSEGEGTHKFFVIDFVSSGCNNWPGIPEYDDPMPNAGVWWHVTNPDGGIANNGTWSFDP